MATNHYFNVKNPKQEQLLVEDLVIEAIKIHGMDVHYMPRTLVNKNKLLGEDPLSAFITQKPIEMYIENVNGFEGEQDIISKFGLEVRDSATFVVSKKRFEKELGMLRPLEGDLIYFPLTKGLFEIKYVEHESPFYQLGKNYVFKLRVELFQFSEEPLETGEEEIDTIASLFDYNVLLTIGSATGAGSFTAGDVVYQYLDGSVTGSFTGADNTATVESVSGNVLTLKSMVGTWAASDATTVYVSSQDHQKYRTVTSIDDNIDVGNKKQNDNDELTTRRDDLLDTDTDNPFGEP